MTNIARNLWQRLYRQRTKDKDTKKYEHTQRGFLVRKYRNMESRIEGIQQNKAHLYIGKNLLST